MIGKLILTSIIIGGIAFVMLSDSFEEYIGPYANAAATDIENLKNDPAVRDKVNQVFGIIYEKLIYVKLSISDFFITS